MNPRLRALLVTAALLAVAWFPLRRAGEIRFDPDPGFALELPVRVGPWTGEALLYCTGKGCERSVTAGARRADGRCPHCGSELDVMAPVERQLLPADTDMRRMQYRRPGGPDLYVTLVVSGRDRASIHRPEVCLSYPGNEIVQSTRLTVPMQGRGPLKVTLLTQRLTTPRGVSRSHFAYWFVARDRETPSHWERMAWMASDRVLRGLTRRWAYISVLGPAREDGGGNAELAEFLQAFEPAMQREGISK